MASAKENVPLAPQPQPRQTSNARPPPPQRPKVANGATEPAAGGGVLKCTCFRLPSRSKKQPSPPPPAVKPSSGSRGSAVAPDDVPAAASRSRSRVTFRASASLATWWPASPSAAASAGAGGSAAPRRASASSAPPRNAAGVPRTASPSFSHWRRSLSPRVMPHGGRASFSFPASPASASSSCMSTPKIPQGFQQQG
ncbi:hypothetical protein PAHAL_3G228600 [Panicum hallii]|uniref:Uncharacterized protein n=1 Tax=Panicum hallii TaxID=206008 RepID=A0A2S3HAU3_9POAL|nr:wiskott-Aldrich syndrome protein homolog 1-like [Panicum hallii]PAN18830.1 hypothetical protein PAHAL_3G228600 [Panicum hallii]